MILDFFNKLGNVGVEGSKLSQGSSDFLCTDPTDLFHLEPVHIPNARFQEVSPTPSKNSVLCPEQWHADFSLPIHPIFSPSMACPSVSPMILIYLC